MILISSLSILEILALAIFANWVTHWFQPLNYFRDKIVEDWTKWTINSGMYGFQSLIKLITCPKCFAFWFTLAYIQDFWMALIVSFVSYIIKFVIDRVEYWYE